MASDKIEILSDSDFKKKVIDASVPVLVDFWAEWCAPCRRLAPTVDALATEFEGKLVVGKLNVDENPSTPVEFSIRGIPTLLLFKGGQVVEAVVGALPKDEIKRLIEPHL
jgi:thioredoxin 1